jgi:hypothetical protein
MEEIKRQLQRAAVVNLDETGCHVGGKVKWVLAAATDRLTLLGVDDHRGVRDQEPWGVGGDDRHRRQRRLAGVLKPLFGALGRAGATRNLVPFRYCHRRAL